MAVQLFGQADLERRLGGPAILIRLCDDDRDGTADPEPVQEIIDEASALGVGLLKNAFPDEQQISNLVSEDAAVQGAVLDIACGLAGQRKPEWVNDKGEPFFGWRRLQGERVLKEIRSRERRAGGEQYAGNNALIRSRSTREKPVRTFQIADTKSDRKGPGGF